MNTDTLTSAVGSTETNLAPGAAQRLQSALAQLEQSRAALRRELLPDAASDANSLAGAEGTNSTPWREPLRHLRRLRKIAGRWPVTALAVQAVQRWWQQQPWRDTGELLAGSMVLRARPLVRRYPVASVAAAAALGALVVAGRPWRWPLVSAQLRPVPGHITRWALAQLTSAPMQTALAGLLLKSLLAGDSPAGSRTEQAPGSDPAPYPSPTLNTSAAAAPTPDRAAAF